VYARGAPPRGATPARTFFLSRPSLDLDCRMFPRASLRKLKKPARIADFLHVVFSRCAIGNGPPHARASAAAGPKSGIWKAKRRPKKIFQQHPGIASPTPGIDFKTRESEKTDSLSRLLTLRFRARKRPDSSSMRRPARRKSVARDLARLPCDAAPDRMPKAGRLQRGATSSAVRYRSTKGERGRASTFR